MTCATCRHAQKPADPNMRGWVNCAHERAPWHYLRPGQACQFTPARWEAK